MTRNANAKGNQALRSFKDRLRALPITVADAVAQRAAPDMTRLTQESFAGGRSVYGEARPLGVDGNALDLERTGAIKRDLKFTREGTIIRAVLGPKYAKFLIRYGILPNGRIPEAWRRQLNVRVDEVAREAKRGLA